MRPARVRGAAWVACVVDGAQPFGRHLRVHLRRRHARVAEQLLHDTDVGTVVEHVGGARVTEYVRADAVRESDARARGAHNLPAALARDSTAARVQEDRVAVARRLRTRARAVAQRQPPAPEIFAQRRARGPSDGHHAFLVALAEHADQAVLEIEGIEIQSHELADADSGGIEELEDGPVALGERIAPRHRAEQCGDLDLVERLRDALRHSRRHHNLARVVREEAFAHQEPVERAHGHKRRAIDAGASSVAPSSSRSSRRWCTYAATVCSSIAAASVIPRARTNAS